MVGAVGQPDSHLGEAPCAYVELMQGANIHSEALIKFVEEKLDNKLAMPVYLEVLTELPKTPVGKIFKPDLRKKAISRVFNSQLDERNITASVIEVVEDKIHGLTAIISATAEIEDTVIDECLSQFIVPWRRG